MGNIGVVRRIDDLGRVVIPKEIRGLLNIKNGELLNILVNDDYVILKKEKESFNVYNIINSLVDIFVSLFDDIIIVTSRDKIIKAENINLNNEEVGDLVNFISSNDKYESIVLESYVIGNVVVQGYFLILPIIVDSNYFGVLCVITKTKDKIDIYNTICKFMLKIIDNKLDIT